MSEADVRFTIEPVVLVAVKGEHKIEDWFPRTCEDAGLLERLFGFQVKNRIFPVIRGGYGGPGSYCGIFTSQDAVKIETWLLAEGAKREDEETRAVKNL